ncbi:ferritin 2 light chain [Lasioglossum baleicum]|uniref:ferritin 2 light chain n=1 Tax=Lasioglossum baleicum TaxID=434251 RepID=UPI003FCC3578
MLFFGVLPLLLVAVSAKDCYDEMTVACDPKGGGPIGSCSAMYGGIANAETSLQEFANANIHESFHLLMISSYFGNYEVNREGFKKLYRHYSDKLWEDAIDVMKYIAKRGGKMNFAQPSHLQSKDAVLEELKSLALVLDKQKRLAEDAFRIHSSALSGYVHNTPDGVQKPRSHDPAIAHYIEERFLEAHTERIRDLSGYITELKDLSLSGDNQIPVSVFLFDEYLQKSL